MLSSCFSLIYLLFFFFTANNNEDKGRATTRVASDEGEDGATRTRRRAGQ